MPRAKWLQNIHSRVKHLLTDSGTGISALDKPVGILSHPNGNGTEGINRSIITSKYDFTDEAFNIEYTKNNPYPTTCIEKLYLLNRLDSATSGVILVSTNKKSNIAIKKSFAKRNQITKCYYAISFVNPQITHKIKNMIGRELVWSNKMKLQKHEEEHVRAKASIPYHTNKSSSSSVKKDVTCTTHATILQYIPSHKYSQLPIVLLKLTPVTGYTHQLRFQCAQHGFWIVGDKVYGDFDKNKVFMKAIRNHVNNIAAKAAAAVNSKVVSASIITDEPVISTLNKCITAASNDSTGSLSDITTAVAPVFNVEDKIRGESNNKPSSSSSTYILSTSNNPSSGSCSSVGDSLSFNRMYLHSHSIRVSFDHQLALLTDADNSMIDKSSSSNKEVVLAGNGGVNLNLDNAVAPQRTRNTVGDVNSKGLKTFTAVSPLPPAFSSRLLGFTLPLVDVVDDSSSSSSADVSNPVNASTLMIAKQQMPSSIPTAAKIEAPVSSRRRKLLSSLSSTHSLYTSPTVNRDDEDDDNDEDEDDGAPEKHNLNSRNHQKRFTGSRGRRSPRKLW